MNANFNIVESNLLVILNELRLQPEIGAQFPSDRMEFGDYIEQLREYIEDAGEYGIAFESIVASLQRYNFSLSGKASVKLLEVGLIFGYKTELTEDKIFDRRY